MVMTPQPCLWGRCASLGARSHIHQCPLCACPALCQAMGQEPSRVHWALTVWKKFRQRKWHFEIGDPLCSVLCYGEAEGTAEQ